VFSGGVRDFVGKNIEPEDFANFKEAMILLGENIERDVASIFVSAPHPREIILSGRLMEHEFIRMELANRLSKYAPVARVKNLSEVAKEAACGAYIIGEGLLGGRYHKLVENMEIGSVEAVSKS